jgi:hypothetical protein
MSQMREGDIAALINKRSGFFEPYIVIIGTCQPTSKEAWTELTEGGSIPSCRIYWGSLCQYSIKRSRF